MSLVRVVPDGQAAGELVDGLVLLEGRAFEDERGWFLESFHGERYRQAGIDSSFVQDNVSWSHEGVLRGLHYQGEPHPQAKLVGVLQGMVFDVAVDVRPASAHFGRWFGCYLSGENRRQLYVPAGFAHGFLVISGPALVSYKCSAYYAPESERSLRWDDPDVAIDWPAAPARISPKDRAAPLLQSLRSAPVTE